MKYLKIIGIALLSIFLGLVVFIICTPGRKMEFNPGPEFEYSALSDVKNGQYDRYREYIPLKDGKKIAVTYMVPNNQENKEFPTILQYSPYTSAISILRYSS